MGLMVLVVTAPQPLEREQTDDCSFHLHVASLRLVDRAERCCRQRLQDRKTREHDALYAAGLGRRTAHNSDVWRRCNFGLGDG
jgi:hypothetical protein